VRGPYAARRPAKETAMTHKISVPALARELFEKTRGAALLTTVPASFARQDAS
jgi:hypothetical protein